jgi:hypothetical protein
VFVFFVDLIVVTVLLHIDKQNLQLVTKQQQNQPNNNNKNKATTTEHRNRTIKKY